MTKISHFPGTRFLTSPPPQGFGIRFHVDEDKSVFATIACDAGR
ncbi:MAG: hypothetical protein Q9P01_15440 [Anaerolineae bacterium]|nr:hypothetical protein [Anaerolineae bacterium]